MFSPREGLSWFSVVVSLVIATFFTFCLVGDLREPGPLRMLSTLLDVAFLGLTVCQLINDLWWRSTRNWARLTATVFALAAGVLILVWSFDVGAGTHIASVVLGGVWALLALACLVTEVRYFAAASSAA